MNVNASAERYIRKVIPKYNRTEGEVFQKRISAKSPSI